MMLIYTYEQNGENFNVWLPNWHEIKRLLNKEGLVQSCIIISIIIQDKFDIKNIKESLNYWDALFTKKFYKSCLYDKLITLALTAVHTKGSKGAGLQGDGP